MGPKKKQDEPGKKAQKAMQNKVIEDKTFGLKNKNKSRVVQQYVPPHSFPHNSPIQPKFQIREKQRFFIENAGHVCLPGLRTRFHFKFSQIPTAFFSN